MQVNTQTILGVTFVLVALVVMLNNAQGTNTIIGALAEGYERAVGAFTKR